MCQAKRSRIFKKETMEAFLSTLGQDSRRVRTGHECAYESLPILASKQALVEVQGLNSVGGQVHGACLFVE